MDVYTVGEKIETHARVSLCLSQRMETLQVNSTLIS